MEHPYRVTEVSLQPLNDLGGEGYLGKHIEHLPAAGELLLYQVDVKLRLTAGGDAMEEYDIMLPEELCYSRINLLLYRAQRCRHDQLTFICTLPAASPFSRAAAREIVRGWYGSLHYFSRVCHVVI